MTDEQLVEKFLTGDEKALEALIERYLKSIYNFIFQLVREKNAAEDVAQEVFVKMWENLSGFNQEKKFNSWLYAIARNTAFDWLRKKKALPFAAFENTEGYNLLEEIIDEKGFDYRQFIIEMDMRLEMEGILSKLPITAQSILLLHHKHGFSLVEIAKILGQSSNTVKSKYRRVILFLRQEIATKDLKREDQKFEFAPKRIPAA